MAGRRPHHVTVRAGVYYLRLPVPADLQSRIGRQELRWSLATKSPLCARRRGLAGTVAFRKLCDKLRRMKQLSETDLQRMLLGLHRSLTAEAIAPAFESEQAREYFKARTEDLLNGLMAIVAEDDFEATGDITEFAAQQARSATTRFAQHHGVDLDGLPEPLRQMLMHGVARALAEQQRLILQRVADRLAPYQPQDPFFAANGASTSGEVDGPTLSEAFKAYAAAKAGVHWKPRTVREHDRVLRWAQEFFGADTRVGAITKNEFRDFRDALVKLRRKGAAGAAFSTLMGAPEADALSRKTASKYFSFVTAAFNWFVSEGYISASPAGTLSVVVSKSKKDTSRRPFSEHEMAVLFKSPMYSGCRSAIRRMTFGPHVIKDGYYWVPLIGALSGMRLGEIVQLGTGDVDLGKVAHFDVRADAATGGTVKTDAGWRKVPIHRRLLALGLGAFVAARQKQAASARLFHDIPYGSDGSPSGEYSRWFGRRLDDLKLSHPGLVFHSFRGTFIGALTEIGAPGYVIKAIVGHDQSDDITFGYSGHEGVSLARKKQWIDKVNYLDALPE